jgi:hypothetical protein
MRGFIADSDAPARAGTDSPYTGADRPATAAMSRMRCGRAQAINRRIPALICALRFLPFRPRSNGPNYESSMWLQGSTEPRSRRGPLRKTALHSLRGFRLLQQFRQVSSAERCWIKIRPSPSVPRIPRADGAGVRVHVADGTVVVALGAVGIGSGVRRHIGPAAGDVPLNGVATRIRACAAEILCLGERLNCGATSRRGTNGSVACSSWRAS